MSTVEITNMNLVVDKQAIGQAFASLAAPIITAKALTDKHGEQAAKTMMGLEPKEELAKAGEAVIGKYNGLVCRLVIEPESGSWSGTKLEHDPVEGISISNIEVNGKKIKTKP